MASNNSGQNPPPSLGSPLVKIGSQVHGIGITTSTGGIAPPPPPAQASSVTVGSDHPLAQVAPPSQAPVPTSTMAVPPPRMYNPAVTGRRTAESSSAFQSPPSQPPQAQQSAPVHTPRQQQLATASPASTQYHTPASTAHNTPGFVTPTPDQSPVQILSQPVSPAKNTLEALADAFMAGPCYRMTELGLPPLLKPPPLQASSTSIVRLRTLVERRAWGDVLQICGDMLRSSNSAHAPVYTALINCQTDDPTSSTSQELEKEVMEILALECHAWLKLRRYADLGREIERWSFCRVNDVTAVPPTWCDFSLQILAATSLQYTDSMAPNRTVDELYALKGSLQDPQSPYHLTINASLSNIFVRQKEWRLALKALEEMLQLVPDIYSHDQSLVDSYSMDILSRQGRILLQAGAITGAKEILGKANEIEVPNQSPHWVVSKVAIQSFTNQGLLNFTLHQYDEALSFFKQASDVLRKLSETVQVYRVEAFVGPTLWIETPQSLMTQVFNNMALSALYTCRMKEAVRILESLVREDPTAYLTERLAFNLCTLYELGADTTGSARKKRVLQLLAKRFYLHDIGPEQFRVG